jgi:hypothetical protein
MIRRLLLLAVVAFVSGCASITGTTNQSVSIQTLEQGGKEVSGALCEMTNSKGKWFITTPGSSMITRSNDDMQVVCKKDGIEPGRASVVSATKGSMFGNIILGGGIGAIIDHNTGAAYEYPSFFQVVMATTTRIEPPPDSAGQAQASTSTTPPPPGAPSPTSPGPQPVRAAVTPSTPAPTAQPASVDSRSVEEKLKDLKRLHDQGLIDTNIYLEQQRKLMDAKN